MSKRTRIWRAGKSCDRPP